MLVRKLLHAQSIAIALAGRIKQLSKASVVLVSLAGGACVTQPILAPVNATTPGTDTG